MASRRPRTVLPPANESQVYVTVSALEAGHISFPERLFVTDVNPQDKVTVPSLSFLVRHPSADSSGRDHRLLFDLGMKRDLSRFPSVFQNYIAERQPIVVHPDVADSLRAGGLDPAADIDAVVLSHVHWDHVGTPEDFQSARFLVGSGTIHLLRNGALPRYPPEIFISDLLPVDRTYEFPPVTANSATAASQQTAHEWKPLASFPAVIDFFGDGSLYVVDSPGHFPGHINLLARVAKNRWIYLGGDCCHDLRILTGEQGIAQFDHGNLGPRTVHFDTDAAKRTLGRINDVLERISLSRDTNEQVEVIVAHDAGWRQRNQHRFFPNTL